MGDAIVFERVGFTYPDATQQVLTDASFSVPEGAFVLVAGATGAGKSTLLRAVNGLVPHFTGGTFAGRGEGAGRDRRRDDDRPARARDGRTDQPARPPGSGGCPGRPPALGSRSRDHGRGCRAPAREDRRLRRSCDRVPNGEPADPGPPRRRARTSRGRPPGGAPRAPPRVVPDPPH